MSGASARVWLVAGIANIDVRGLPPPQPMVEIIRLLESPGVGSEVIVHHEREPIYLYPELAERGWTHDIVAIAPGNVRLRLTRTE